MSKSYGLCAREQIILIDGYKMLRMELRAQRGWALEWNGVHSWVTSLFQWCSKRRINPPNSLWKKNTTLCLRDSYKTTDSDTEGWHTYSLRENLRRNRHQVLLHIKLSCHFNFRFFFPPQLNFTFYSEPGYHWKHIRAALQVVTLSSVK